MTDEPASNRTEDSNPNSKTAITKGSAKKKRKSKKRSRSKSQPGGSLRSSGGSADYPRHAVRKALRIPYAILEQNAGRPCSDRDAAGFAGMGYHGPFRVELSSAIKYGFLSRPQPGTVELTELGKKALRPQNPSDELDALRQAVLNAPKISDVYKYYRGENIPDEPFFGNVLSDKFRNSGGKAR